MEKHDTVSIVRKTPEKPKKKKTRSRSKKRKNDSFETAQGNVELDDDLSEDSDL